MKDPVKKPLRKSVAKVPVIIQMEALETEDDGGFDDGTGRGNASGDDSNVPENADGSGLEEIGEDGEGGDGFEDGLSGEDNGLEFILLRENYVKVIAPANFHAEPDADSAVVTVGLSGDLFFRNGFHDDWSRVLYHGQTCYVSNEYVKDTLTNAELERAKAAHAAELAADADSAAGGDAAGSDTNEAGGDAGTADDNTNTAGSDTGAAGDNTNTAGSDTNEAGSDTVTAGGDSGTAGGDNSTAGGDSGSSGTGSEVASSLSDAEIAALSNELISWGYTNERDAENRPLVAVTYQEKYGSYNAFFIRNNGRKISLTFNESYEAGETGTLLDILKEKGVHATFYCTCGYLQANPDLVSRMIAEGHTIGNRGSDQNTALPEMDLAAATADILQIGRAHV